MRFWKFYWRCGNPVVRPITSVRKNTCCRNRCGKERSTFSSFWTNQFLTCSRFVPRFTSTSVTHHPVASRISNLTESNLDPSGQFSKMAPQNIPHSVPKRFGPSIIRSTQKDLFYNPSVGSYFPLSIVEYDGMKDTKLVRLWKRTTRFLLVCFTWILWAREVASFHPTTLGRNYQFEKGFCDNLRPTFRHYYLEKRQQFFATTSVATDDDKIKNLTGTNSTPSLFDYRKLPPISDTTRCEVIEAFQGTSKSSNSSDHENEFYFPSPEELAHLPKGDRGGYHIVRQYTVAVENITSVTNVTNVANATNATSLPQGKNLTLQNALTILDPVNYPTLTRARKACRKGMVLVHRNPKLGKFQNASNRDTVRHMNISCSSSDLNFKRGNVGDRVEPGDIIGVQLFLGTYRKKQCYPNIEYSRPQFQLPVLYEDDHLAVINKPAGVAVYSETRMSGAGDKTGTRKTVHFALPFALTPPKKGTSGGILRRPGIVHRLDKPTSGLLLVAKTKASMDSLKEQFQNREVQKIYTAIVNGDLMPHQEEYQKQQRNETHNSQNSTEVWNLIDYPQGGKHALTSWKILKRAPSLNARDGFLTMIRIRLHTGRYHQIRRHFAWWCFRPLVGDHLYAGLLQAHHFRKKGLFLSSNGISFLHPVQNDDESDGDKKLRRVEVTIDVPKRFDKLMKAEESWAIHNQKQQNVSKPILDSISSTNKTAV